MGGKEFDRAVSRLAQYRPFADEGRNLGAMLRDLVLAAAAEAGTGGVFESLESVQHAFAALWGLDIEPEEIRAARDLLIGEGKARPLGDGFGLTTDALAELDVLKAESENLRKLAFGAWATEVHSEWPGLSRDDFRDLVADLEAWLEHIIVRHGVEAALVLYPQHPRAERVLEQIETLTCSVLPARDPMLAEIREAALRRFVRQPSPAQRSYLANRLNTAYFLTVLTLDPAASKLMQDNVKGHRVYLDTNVVYAVIGLAGSAHETISALRLLDLTRQLGYTLAVTPWTVAELRASLGRAREYVLARRLPRRELADLLAQSHDNSIVASYWAAYRDRGIHPRDFFDYHEQFERLLEGHGVTVVDEGTTAIERNRELIDAHVALLEQHLPEGAEPDVKVLEHDVKHRLLIERLRGDGNVRFTNARYWFLTRDGKLPSYAADTLDGSRVQLPFCVATSAWLQVMRSFVPRTDDLDKTIVDLLTSACIPMLPHLPEWVVEEVVGRMDQYENADPRLASQVLADTALVDDIRNAPEDERGRRVDQALERKMVELVDKLDAAERLAASSHRNATDARRMAEEQEAHFARERQALEMFRLELERERQELERERRERIDNEEEVRGELERLKRLLVGVGTSVLAALVTAAAAVLIATDSIDAPALIVAAVCAALGSILLATWGLFGRRQMTRVAAILATGATIIGFVWFLVDKVRRPSRPGAPPPTIEAQR
jgi:predicted nucleic acid-binding protein